MNTEHVESTLDDLLTDDERGDLARVIDTVNRYSTTLAAADMQHRLEHIYLEGRLTGLCREGALELVTDALVAMRAGNASTNAAPNG